MSRSAAWRKNRIVLGIQGTALHCWGTHTGAFYNTLTYEENKLFGWKMGYREWKKFHGE